MGQDLHETTVKIRGASYQLRTDLESERVQELAHYVDDTMKALDPKSSLPPAKLSVLTSLSIAGELFASQRESDSWRRTIEVRVERLNSLLEKAMGKDPHEKRESISKKS